MQNKIFGYYPNSPSRVLLPSPSVSIEMRKHWLFPYVIALAILVTFTLLYLFKMIRDRRKLNKIRGISDLEMGRKIMGGSESDEIKYEVNESMVARKEFVKE